jgi:hypothetical protein
VTTPTHEALAKVSTSAVHLEMRDSYTPTDPDYLRYRQGFRYHPDDRPDWFHSWADLVTGAKNRGVTLRRARIVSEPVTDYIRYEHHVTFLNIASGEDVRWLPRKKATSLALPGNDFWLFDREIAVINYFSGQGDSAGREVSRDPQLTAFLKASFEAVWDLATPHAEYHPT